MRSWMAGLTRVSSPDEDVQRRGKLLIVIAMCLLLIALAFIPVILSTAGGTVALIVCIVAVFVNVGLVFLARAGYVAPAAYIMIGMTLVGISASVVSGSSTASTLFYLVIAVLLAGTLLSPVQIWTALVASILTIAISVGLLPAEVRDNVEWRQASMGAPLLLLFVALLTFLGSSGLNRALGAAQQARTDAEQASGSLAASNSALETRVEERTAALRLIADEQRALAAELKQSLTAQQELNRVIAELAVPILPISTGSLVVPLIGSIDSTRASQLLTTILERVEASGARTLLLDVTGVAIIDTQVAAVLLHIADAARLMGAETMLVGIRPEVAQTLVQLGVDLRGLHTAATLQDGVATLVRGLQ